jgi:hypothetical protein
MIRKMLLAANSNEKGNWRPLTETDLGRHGKILIVPPTNAKVLKPTQDDKETAAYSDLDDDEDKTEEDDDVEMDKPKPKSKKPAKGGKQDH